MKILLTGAGGQLAKAITYAFKCHEIISLKRTDLDITDFDAVRSSVSRIKPDVLINCAAYNDVDGAETDWHNALLVNGIGVKNLALACNKTAAALVHFSSDYVFGGGTHADRKRPFTIADHPEPANRYGESKLLGEMFVRDLADRYFLIRTSWVFGEGERSFPNKLLGWASEKQILKVAEDQVSSPTFARDLTAAISEIIQTENFGLYHITNSGFCSRYEWADFILKARGWKGRLERAKSSDFKDAAVRPKFSAMDNFPVQQVFGIKLPSWEDATGRFLGI